MHTVAVFDCFSYLRALTAICYLLNRVCHLIVTSALGLAQLYLVLNLVVLSGVPWHDIIKALPKRTIRTQNHRLFYLDLRQENSCFNLYITYIFCGLECVDHSFAYVAFL
jgi:hypothetical protein